MGCSIAARFNEYCAPGFTELFEKFLMALNASSMFAQTKIICGLLLLLCLCQKFACNECAVIVKRPLRISLDCLHMF